MPGAERAVRHCTDVSKAEQTTLDLIRGGASTIEVHYLNRLVATVTRAELPAWYLLTGEKLFDYDGPRDNPGLIGAKIAAGIEALGETPIPGVRGKNKQAVVAILERAVGSTDQALLVLGELRPFLK
jgi:hypothetical protein